MVAAPRPPNFRGDLSKRLNLEGVKFKGGPKILGGRGSMKPNDAMVVVLNNILLCLLSFRSIHIVYVS